MITVRKPVLAAGVAALMAIGTAGAAHAGPPAPVHAAPVTAGVTLAGHRGAYRHHALPRRAVVRSLYRRGYRDVHAVHFRHGYWRARAYGRRGLIALTVDPRNGAIVGRRVIAPYRHHGRSSAPRHFGGHGPGFSFSFGLN